jgi:hypothetical protein
VPWYVPRVKRVFALLVVSSGLSLSACDGCNKSVPAAPDTGPEAATPVAQAEAGLILGDGGRHAAPVAPWAAVPGATAALLPNMSIPDRFQLEAAARPPGLKVNVESVFAALEKAGFKLFEKKQHLGQTFGARYCMGARSVKGAAETDPTQLYLSVCEFINPEVAEMSRVYSTEHLKTIPNRNIHTKQQTTLTVRGESDAPDTTAAMTKALAVYDAL